MFRPLIIATLATATLLPSAQAGEPAKPLTMTPVTVRDPMVNNIVAATLLKPEGWRFEGGMKWYPNMSHQADFEARISNPNTLEQLEFLPIACACHFRNPVMPMQRLSNYMGSIVLEPMSPNQLVTEFTLPKVRKVSTRSARSYDMPELAKLCTANNGGGNWKASRTRVSYTYQDTPVEEDFYVACFYFPEASLAVNNATVTIWGVGLAFSIRAAQGELDQATPKMLACVHSLKGTAEHLKQVQYVQHLFCNRMNMSIRDAGELSKRISANNDYALDLMRSARATRDASETHISKQFSDYIRGTQEYTYGGTSYSLPNNYQHAWLNSNGTILLSNSAGFDPNTTHSGTWNELKPVR
ncbi:MAG TPA: hypothetical protein PLN21_08785 [Gemmatales bacterium]|nr:hypothetical protein [Gemmatales bacterium]